MRGEEDKENGPGKRAGGKQSAMKSRGTIPVARAHKTDERRGKVVRIVGEREREDQEKEDGKRRTKMEGNSSRNPSAISVCEEITRKLKENMHGTIHKSLPYQTIQ